jgi:hypothetical protein
MKCNAVSFDLYYVTTEVDHVEMQHGFDVQK